MLWKLLKHELKASGRIMLPIWAAVLVLSVFVNLMDLLFLNSDSILAEILTVVIILLFVVGCIAAGLMAVVTMVLRFQKSMLSREGYLTHTLPVNVHQLIWSRMLVALIYIVLTTAVIMLSFMISIAQTGVVREFVNVFLMIWADLMDMSALHGTFYVIEGVLSVIVAGLSSCLMFYAAMSIGHSFANHKTLLSVVFYFLLYCANQVISMLVLLGFTSTKLVQSLLDTQYMEQVFMDTHLLMLIIIGMYLLISAAYYVLTTWMLKRRLNLQ